MIFLVLKSQFKIIFNEAINIYTWLSTLHRQTEYDREKVRCGQRSQALLKPISGLKCTSILNERGICFTPLVI